MLVLVANGAFAAGSLDPSFGNGGIAITSFGADNRPSAAVLQSDGKIVVATSVGDSATSATLVRYLPDGTLDSTFGSGGIVSELFENQVNITGGLAIQPDGKIVLQAVASNTTGTINESLLARFNSNGTLDSTFGSGGRLVLTYPAPPPYSAAPVATILEPNGDFLVLFSLTPPFRNHSPDLTALARYTSNGTLDSTFGSGGRSAAVALGAIPTAMALLSNGNTLVVTTPQITAEFGPAGTLLSSVSAGTVVSSTIFSDPIFLRNSTYLFLTTAHPASGPRSDLDSQVIRFLPTGVVDTTFQSPLFDFAPVGSPLTSLAEAMAVAPNGQIVASGEAVTSLNTSIGFGVARLNADGSIDTSFGVSGIVTTPFPHGGQALGVFVQPDGKIVAIGQEFSGDTSVPINLALARYLPQ
jgi:uncharacterized delta-60 repeat protein